MYNDRRKKIIYTQQSKSLNFENNDRKEKKKNMTSKPNTQSTMRSQDTKVEQKCIVAPEKVGLDNKQANPTREST